MPDRAPRKLFKTEKLSAEEGQKLFQRRKRALGVDWRDVDTVELKAALCSALASSGAVMFSSAAGGIGVCITVFLGREKLKDYAMSAADLSEMLSEVVDHCASPSEDVRAMMAGEEAAAAVAD